MLIICPSSIRQYRQGLVVMSVVVPFAGYISLLPILGYASLAIFCVVHVITGKDQSGHAVSSITNKNCSLLTVL